MDYALAFGACASKFICLFVYFSVFVSVIRSSGCLGHPHPPFEPPVTESVYNLCRRGIALKLNSHPTKMNVYCKQNIHNLNSYVRIFYISRFISVSNDLAPTLGELLLLELGTIWVNRWQYIFVSQWVNAITHFPVWSPWINMTFRYHESSFPHEWPWMLVNLITLPSQESDGVPNHRKHDCLYNRSKETSKSGITGRLRRKSTSDTGGFPHKRPAVGEQLSLKAAMPLVIQGPCPAMRKTYLFHDATIYANRHINEQQGEVSLILLKKEICHKHYGDVTMGRWRLKSLASWLFTQLFIQAQTKKTSKIRVTDLCVGNSPVTDVFSAQMASNTEYLSIWWRHHEVTFVAGAPGLSLRQHSARQWQHDWHYDGSRVVIRQNTPIPNGGLTAL